VTIKLHHDVSGLPERMNMKLVEPLRELFIDVSEVETKKLAREAAAPRHSSWDSRNNNGFTSRCNNNGFTSRCVSKTT
jgi:post-segregation antitoxin (ccd killing protein)